MSGFFYNPQIDPNTPYSTGQYVASGGTTTITGGGGTIDTSGITALLASTYVPIAGASMSGQLNTIAPVAGSNAANKTYVDQKAADSLIEVGNKLSKFGDTCTGYLKMTLQPAAATDLCNKSYVDGAITNNTVSQPLSDVLTQLSTIPETAGNLLAFNASGITSLTPAQVNTVLNVYSKPDVNALIASTQPLNANLNDIATLTPIANCTLGTNANDVVLLTPTQQRTAISVYSNTEVNSILANYVPLAGSTMTGQLNTITPIADTNAVNKQYVDQAIAGVSGGSLSGAVLIAGSTMTGQLNTIVPIIGSNAVNKQYVDTAIAGVSAGASVGAVLIAGSTMTGQLNTITPVSGSNATNKTYVDAKAATYLPLAGGTLTGALAMGAYTITGLGTPVNAFDATNKTYVDLKAATYLPLTGGTLTGALAMNVYKITGLGTPTLATDAATKAYVDSTAATATTNANTFATAADAVILANSKEYTDQNIAEGLAPAGATIVKFYFDGLTPAYADVVYTSTITINATSPIMLDGVTVKVNDQILVNIPGLSQYGGYWRVSGFNDTVTIMSRIVTVPITQYAQGKTYYISSGDTYGKTNWRQTTASISVFVDPLEFEQYTPSSPTNSAITASAYIHVSHLGPDDVPTTVNQAFPFNHILSAVSSIITANSSVTEFTLLSGYSYKCTAAMGQNVLSNYFTFSWGVVTYGYDGINPGNLFGVQGTINNSKPLSSLAIGFITNNTGSNMKVALIVTNNSISQITTSGNILPYAIIEVVSNTNAISAFTGATSTTAGTVGYIPAPPAGTQNSYLRGDGTWTTAGGLSPVSSLYSLSFINQDDSPGSIILAKTPGSTTYSLTFPAEMPATNTFLAFNGDDYVWTGAGSLPMTSVKVGTATNYALITKAAGGAYTIALPSAAPTADSALVYDGAEYNWTTVEPQSVLQRIVSCCYYNGISSKNFTVTGFINNSTMTATLNSSSTPVVDSYSMTIGDTMLYIDNQNYYNAIYQYDSNNGSVFNFIPISTLYPPPAPKIYALGANFFVSNGLAMAGKTLVQNVVTPANYGPPFISGYLPLTFIPLQSNLDTSPITSLKIGTTASNYTLALPAAAPSSNTALTYDGSSYVWSAASAAAVSTSSNYTFVTHNVNQAVTVGTVVAFNTVLSSTGSIVAATLNSIYYVLPANGRYKCTACLNSTTATSFQMFNNVTGVMAPFGSAGQCNSASGLQMAIGYVTVGATTVSIQVQILANAGTITGYNVAGGQGPWLLIEQVSNNSAISAFTGATSSIAGTVGYIPAPPAGTQNSYLRGDGTWVQANNAPTAAAYIHVANLTVGTVTTTVNQPFSFTATIASASSVIATNSPITQFTLLPGYTYKCTAQMGQNTGVGGWNFLFQWYNVTTSTAFGINGSIMGGTTGGVLASGYITNNTAGNIVVSLMVLQNTNTTITVSTSLYPWAIIEVVSNNNTITQFAGATSSTAGSIGYMPAPAIGQQNYYLRGDGIWAKPTLQYYSASGGNQNIAFNATNFNIPFSTSSSNLGVAGVQKLGTNIDQFNSTTFSLAPGFTYKCVFSCHIHNPTSTNLGEFKFVFSYTTTLPIGSSTYPGQQFGSSFSAQVVVDQQVSLNGYITPTVTTYIGILYNKTVGGNDAGFYQNVLLTIDQLVSQ